MKGFSLFLIVLGSLIVSFFAGYMIASGNQTAENLPVQKQTSSAGWDKDLDDYRRLIHLEEKYQKADEILGKMILLFLADLGLRSENIKFSLRDWIENRNSQAQLPLPTPIDDGDSGALDDRKTDADIASSAENERRRLQLEEQIQNDELDEQDQKVRQGLILKEPAKDLFESRPIKNEHEKLNLVLGSYRGWINLKSGKKLWAELEVSQTPNKDHGLSGKFNLRIYKEGEETPFSNTRGVGNFNDILIPKLKTDAIFIKASDSLFLQVYANLRQGALIGNAYKREERFTHYGTVYLTR